MHEQHLDPDTYGSYMDADGAAKQPSVGEYLRDIRHLLYISAIQQNITSQAILAAMLPDEPHRDTLAIKLAQQSITLLTVLDGMAAHIPEARHG